MMTREEKISFINYEIERNILEYQNYLKKTEQGYCYMSNRILKIQIGFWENYKSMFKDSYQFSNKMIDQYYNMFK